LTRQLVLSDAQRSILESIVRKTHCPKAIATRAGLVLVAAKGRGPSEAARELGCSRGVARLWPERFAQARQGWGEAVEGWDQKVLTGKILDVLASAVSLSNGGPRANWRPKHVHARAIVPDHGGCR
jgi:hypothetical protein